MVLQGDAKREYQRQWVADRRQAWIDENGPCIDCGSPDTLEVDHVDAGSKLISPTHLWSLSPKNPVRVLELSKCVVRCSSCHLKKKVNNKEGVHGRDVHTSKLNEDDVRTIRQLYKTGGITLAYIAEMYGLHKSSVHDIVRLKSWSHVV